jgi:hypothetical protein
MVTIRFPRKAFHYVQIGLRIHSRSYSRGTDIFFLRVKLTPPNTVINITVKSVYLTKHRAMKTYGHCMEVSGELNAPAASPRGKEPPVPIG